jgi:trehalose utilization protein
MQRIFIKKCFLSMVGSVCSVKWFTTGSRNSLKDVRKSQMMPDQVRKWLRQQSKDCYAAGFDALVKQWDKCIDVGGGYVEK